MMMEIRYLLKALLLPPFIQLLMLLCAIQFRKKMPKFSLFLGIFAIVSLWFLSTPVTVNYLVKTLERVPALHPSKLEDITADAIIVLSGSQNESAPEFGQPVSTGGTLSRIRYGALLQRFTGLPILLSGGSVSGREERSLAETMAFDLETGFGGEANWLEMKSRTTAENARYSYGILSAEEKTSVVLVTSAIHMPRAQWSFEQVGFTVIPAPTSFTPEKPLTVISFLPNAPSLQLSNQVMHEWLGYLTYQIVYRKK